MRNLRSHPDTHQPRQGWVQQEAVPRVAQQQGDGVPPPRGRWMLLAGSRWQAGGSGPVSLKPGFFCVCQTPVEMLGVKEGWDFGPETKSLLCALACSRGGNLLRSLVSRFDLGIYLFLNINSLWHHSSSPTTFTLPDSEKSLNYWAENQGLETKPSYGTIIS